LKVPFVNNLVPIGVGFHSSKKKMYFYKYLPFMFGFS
jgi:hypothetical protein